MSVIRRLIQRLEGTTAIPDEPITYQAIGVVRNSQRRPRPDGWQDMRSEIILRDDLIEALGSIDGFSHLIVVFHLNQVPPTEARKEVRVNGVERGVLATRSQLRPNTIGVSVVPLLRHRKGVLQVRGLDATDGTPVLDIKPYLPPYDAVPEAGLPDWAASAGK